MVITPAERLTGVPEGRLVVLRDGSAVTIRRVRGTDAPLLADGFARLSAASRRMRFMGVKKDLSAAELRYFTDVDHHDHEALGALDRGSGHGVGIARYIRDADDPQAAEIAVTIVDDWQSRGLGTELLAQLSDRARQEGIRRFTALADAENVAVAALLRNAGARLVRRGRGTVEYEITLTSGAARGPERKCALSRGAHLQALTERGRRVRTVKGDVQVQVPATDEPAHACLRNFVLAPSRRSISAPARRTDHTE